MSRLPLLLLLLPSMAICQRPGAQKSNAHPSLPIQQCTGSMSCRDESTSIVLDSNWRWVHEAGDYTNCFAVSVLGTIARPSSKAPMTNFLIFLTTNLVWQTYIRNDKHGWFGKLFAKQNINDLYL